MKETETGFKLKQYSRYDNVKIKILKGSHFYYFSRFLLANKLAFLKINEKNAIKVSIELKKKLSWEVRLEITEEEFDKLLFDILEDLNLNAYIPVYKAHWKIKPFLILLAGPPGVGLSSFTTLYASSLCVSNIVSTSLIL